MLNEGIMNNFKVSVKHIQGRNKETVNNQSRQLVSGPMSNV